MDRPSKEFNDAANKVVKFMIKMRPNTKVFVADVKVNDKQLFVELVKHYIDLFHDASFSDDYSIIYKQYPIPEIKCIN